MLSPITLVLVPPLLDLYGVATSLHVEFKHSHVKQYITDYAEWRIMPNSRSSDVGPMYSVRHNHRLSRNARRGSDSRYLRGAACSGPVRWSARSLMARLARR